MLLHKYTVISRFSTPQVQKNNPFVHTNTVVWRRHPADLHDFTHAPETMTSIQSRPREKCPHLLDFSWTRGSKPPWIRCTKAQRETVWHGCTPTMGCICVFFTSLHWFSLCKWSRSSQCYKPGMASVSFNFRLPDIILLSEHRKYSHIYCIW